MTDSELLALIKAVRTLVRPRLTESPDARHAARLLGRWLLEEAERAEGGWGEEGEGGGAASRRQPGFEQGEGGGRGVGERAGNGRSSSGIVPLKVGDAKVHVNVAGSTEDLGRARLAGAAEEDGGAGKESGGSEIDLALVERRCRMKAESCLVFIDRRAAEGDGERERALIDRVDAMISEARSLPDCFLWVFWRERKQPADGVLRTIAACYRSLAEVVSLVRRIDELGDDADREDAEAAMQLMAEATSALRVAMEKTWLSAPDADQDEAHAWLRIETRKRGIFIPRHMKLDDPADPLRAEEVVRETAGVRARAEDRAAEVARVREWFGQIRYHAGRIERNPEHADPHDRRKLVEAIELLRSRGVKPTDPRFREVLPVRTAELIAAADSAAARDVAARIEAGSEAESGGGDVDEDEGGSGWSEQVARVRAMVEGRSVVIVGGEPRPDAAERIKGAFGLSGVEWVRLTEHGTGEPIRAPIGRAETALVLVLVKLTGHLHAEEASECARLHDKPCVYLRAGYNPEQIADSVLRQASRKLGTVAAE